MGLKRYSDIEITQKKDNSQMKRRWIEGKEDLKSTSWKVTVFRLKSLFSTKDDDLPPPNPFYPI
jgi:hypothetical protein